MNTTENNKLIAEFMGFENHLKNNGVTKVYIDNKEYIQNWECFNKEKNVLITPIEMKFHSDWNWLMEVVEKIESLKVIVEIRENVCYIETSSKNYYSELEDTKLQATYKAVVEFIKWYNQQNQ
jgi:hypothetical protein